MNPKFTRRIKDNLILLNYKVPVYICSSSTNFFLKGTTVYISGITNLTSRITVEQKQNIYK